MSPVNAEVYMTQSVQQDSSKAIPIILLPAPSVKNSDLSAFEAKDLYRSVLMSVRNMFQVHNLIHGNLSEYTILYYLRNAYIVGASQSVEHDHPEAAFLLRRDLFNVTEVFRNMRVAVLHAEELFEWVTIPMQDWEARLDRLLAARVLEDSSVKPDFVGREIVKKNDYAFSNNSWRESTSSLLSGCDFAMGNKLDYVDDKASTKEEVKQSEGFEDEDAAVKIEISCTHVHSNTEDDYQSLPMLQVDGETPCIEEPCDLLNKCKDILKKLLNDEYDKFEIMSLASKFSVSLLQESSFSRQKYLLQLRVLENIMKEDKTDNYNRIYEETLRLINVVKPKGYRCCLIGCPFTADRHSNYVKHLQQVHPGLDRLACNFQLKCKRVFSSIQYLMDHIKLGHSSIARSEASVRLPIVTIVCKCSVHSCGGKQFETLQQLMTHMNVFHAKEYRSCIFDGCSSQFTPHTVTRHHFRKKHIDVKKTKLKEENLVNPAGVFVCADNIDHTDDVSVYEGGDEDNDAMEGYNLADFEFLESGLVHGTSDDADQGDYFLMAYADFLNRMCHVKYVPHTTMQIIATEFLNHCTKSQKIKEIKLRESLTNNHMTEEAIDEIIKNVLNEDDFMKAMKELNTDYKQEKFFKENFKYVEPLEIVLNKGDVEKGAKKDCFHYIPVIESVKALLEDPTVIAVFENAREDDHKKPGVMSDVKDGSVIKSIKFFRDNPGAYTLMFYSDAVELVNPLGAARGKHKVVQIFFTLAEIPRSQRSQVDRMQLAMIVREKLFKKYGISKIYKIMIDDLKNLEDGITVENPVPRKVKCGILLHSGDNLEAHTVGGFSTNFSSRDICRFCHISYDDLNGNIHGLDNEAPHEGWTIEEYDNICDFIERNDNQAEELNDCSITVPVLNLEEHLFDEFDESDGREACDSDSEMDEEDQDERQRTFGLRQRCPFNVLSAFHAVYGFPPDILHDLMEGW